jgi:hypothetical protein
MQKPLIFAAIIGAATATGTSAQTLEGISLETGLSTLGFYIAPKIDINPQWQARAPLYLGSHSDNFDLDGSTVDGKLSSNSLALMADYKLGDAGFRLSGGVSLGGYKLEGSATSLTIEGNTYTGNFTAKLEQKNELAPVLAIGYARDFGNSWGFVAELGARFTSFEVSTTGQDAITNPAERAQFDADLAQANRDLSDIKLLPFLTLGVSYRF